MVLCVGVIGISVSCEQSQDNAESKYKDAYENNRVILPHVKKIIKIEGAGSGEIMIVYLNTANQLVVHNIYVMYGYFSIGDIEFNDDLTVKEK